MNKTIARELMKEINQKREQLIAIREEVEDLLDYLEVLEARTRDKNKPLLRHAVIVKYFNLRDATANGGR